MISIVDKACFASRSTNKGATQFSGAILAPHSIKKRLFGILPIFLIPFCPHTAVGTDFALHVANQKNKQICIRQNLATV